MLKMKLLLPIAFACTLGFADFSSAIAMPILLDSANITAPSSDIQLARGGRGFRGGGHRGFGARGSVSHRGYGMRGSGMRYGRNSVGRPGAGRYRVGGRYYGGIWYGARGRYWGGRYWAYGRRLLLGVEPSRICVDLRVA